jgi:glycerol-3-phosphate acyltransferase PlsX
MGGVLAQDLHGIEAPRVGLLNVGEEDIKGTAELREAHRRLSQAPINYRGFVEGDDIFSGDADVVVTDGFTGNVALKTSEGLARFISSVMREEFSRGPLRKAGAVAALPALTALKARLDPRAYNGASMIGLAGVVIMSHGGADRLAFANAVRVAIARSAEGRASADRRARRQFAEAERLAAIHTPRADARQPAWSAFLAAPARHTLDELSTPAVELLNEFRGRTRCRGGDNSLRKARKSS